MSAREDTANYSATAVVLAFVLTLAALGDKFLGRRAGRVLLSTATVGLITCATLLVSFPRRF